MAKFTLSAFTDEASPSLDGQIAAARANGLTKIEARNIDGRPLVSYPAAEASEINKHLAAEGLSLSAIGSPFGKIALGGDHAAHLEDFKRAMALGEIFGTSYIRMFSFYIPEGRSRADCEGEVFERVGEFVDAAESAGMVCCHENEHGIYGEDAQSCKRLHDAFGGKLRAVFDPANFTYCGHDAWEAYPLIEPYIEYFHIKDCRAADKRIVPAGAGDCRIADTLALASKREGDTFLSVEPHLKVFAGYSSLEKSEEKSIREDYTYNTNEEAFAAAVNSLKAALKQI